MYNAHFIILFGYCIGVIIRTVVGVLLVFECFFFLCFSFPTRKYSPSLGDSTEIIFFVLLVQYRLCSGPQEQTSAGDARHRTKTRHRPASFASLRIFFSNETYVFYNEINNLVTRRPIRSETVLGFGKRTKKKKTTSRPRK